MPAIGPEFLHRPLPGLSALSWRRASEWFLEGLRIAIPSSARNFGWRPLLVLMPSDGGGCPSLIERSFLGETRCVPVEGEPGDLSLAIALAPEEVFVTSVNLPAAGRRDLKEAVSHRLDLLSPLPKDRIEFAVGPVRETGHDRVDVSLAIVRKETVEALRGGEDGDRISLIGFAPDSCGRLAYVFHERDRASADDLRRALRLIAAIGSMILLFAGADIGLGKRVATAEVHEGALVAIAKSEKERFRFLEHPAPNNTPGVGGAEASAMLAAAGRGLPIKAWIEEIAFRGGVATIRGFAPEGERWPEGAAPSLAASDRPGVNQFSLAVDASVSDE